VESSTAAEISDQVLELDEYIKGGKLITIINNYVRLMVTFLNLRQENKSIFV
jgi:hypothetical protein